MSSEVCTRCGALLGDEELHAEWHRSQDRVVVATSAVLRAVDALLGPDDE